LGLLELKEASVEITALERYGISINQVPKER